MFSMPSFLDNSGPDGLPILGVVSISSITLLLSCHAAVEHSRFVRFYAAYLGDKVQTYKALAYSRTFPPAPARTSA